MGNLEDLIDGKPLFQTVKINMIQMLKEVLSGLEHLHSLPRPIVHRDIKPSNILLLIPKGAIILKAVISDLGCSKQIEAYEKSLSISGNDMALKGTLGWMSPEMLRKGEAHSDNHQRMTLAMDIFSAGLVMYYALTKGHHPFGDKYRRDGNILDNKYDLRHLDSIKKDCLSLNIIKKMIEPEPDRRPSAAESLKHPLFWSSSTTKDFLIKVSDSLENQKTAKTNIEIGNTEIFPKQGWMGELSDEVKNYLEASKHKYRSYDSTKVRDLLRAIRNLSHHYPTLEYNVRISLGASDEEFMDFWISRFPKLLLHTYMTMD